MSKAVPSKMLPMSETMGADAFRDITVERIKLQPIGVNAATAYTPCSPQQTAFSHSCLLLEFYGLCENLLVLSHFYFRHKSDRYPQCGVWQRTPCIQPLGDQEF